MFKTKQSTDFSMGCNQPCSITLNLVNAFNRINGGFQNPVCFTRQIFLDPEGSLNECGSEVGGQVNERKIEKS
jgi:hypothetical protein